VKRQGFQLTNPNYTHSVALLQEHFGQLYRQIEAHMQALINIPTPNQLYSSLQEFHDNTESHICSLDSLGKKEASYSTLLIPWKTPCEYQTKPCKSSWEETMDSHRAANHHSS